VVGCRSLRNRRLYGVVSVCLVRLAAPGVATASTVSQGAINSRKSLSKAVEHHTNILTYHFDWITFVFVGALVVVYYLFMLRESRREFERVVREKFGKEVRTRG